MLFLDFQKHIHQNLPFLIESKLLIAISGGLDSVVLTHLCHKLNVNMALAHCNFNLRSGESHTDEDFVIQLAKDLDLEVFTERFDTKKYSKDHKMSIQMAARELRYNWFEALTNQFQFDYVLTAHHTDDNLETFLINLSRGTGLEGLKGIPQINNNIVRPLLPFSREAISTYATDNKIEWREDSSNASIKYMRNKLRHDVIPVLKEMNPQCLQNFQATLSNLSDTADIVEESVDAVLKRAITFIDDNYMAFSVKEFKKLNNPKAYLFEVFKDYGFTEWHAIVNLLDAQSGKIIASSTHRLIKDRDCLLLSHIPKNTFKNITIDELVTQIETPMGTLFFNEANAVLSKELHTIYVDKSLLKYPLKLRQWQEGDYFYPLGMSGKKKLSKYFKDEKLSLIDKENVWLLCSNNAVVWVVQRRADNRFKVTETTKQIMRIQLKSCVKKT